MISKRVLCFCLAFVLAATWAQFSLAQPSVGLQSPLAVFASWTLGPVTLEGGVPLRLSPLAVFTTAKLSLGKLELDTISFQPFLGAGATLRLSKRSPFQWLALAGLGLSIPDSRAELFAQLGLAPDRHTGLLESLAMGVRYRF